MCKEHAEEKFHLAIAAAPNAMLMIDRTWLIVHVIAHIEKFCGHGHQKLNGRPRTVARVEGYGSAPRELSGAQSATA